MYNPGLEIKDIVCKKLRFCTDEVSSSSNRSRVLTEVGALTSVKALNQSITVITKKNQI